MLFSSFLCSSYNMFCNQVLHLFAKLFFINEFIKGSLSAKMFLWEYIAKVKSSAPCKALCYC